MKTCGKCKWWQDVGKDGYGICYNMQGEEKEGGYGAVTAMKNAYTCDGSAYYSALCTNKDFGCNEWEKK